jgi:TolA-binding protein
LLAEQAALQIALTYQNQLQLQLRAVESYLELNFARGGNDVELQNSIFQIATHLKNEKRWVEALHVLETFVDSFPLHDKAGQALTMIGQVHQTNEVWEDAIAAYRRVILEYNQGNWAQQSKWSIAECTINLSRWEEAQGAYREYQKAYPDDPKLAEAASRMGILKDLARFQRVVDEDGQRKAFDAQYQIGTIMRSKLSNPVKAIIEYRKVAQRWPDSHLADDALFQVGMIYMELGQTENARDAFFATADQYPTSPLADDALFQVGASFENEAQVMAGVTRGKAIEIASELAQKQAYAVSQFNRREQRAKNLDQIAQLKKAGKSDEADRQTAFQAALNVAFDNANASVVANWAAQQEQALTTAQLADRQDKINAALRKAVASFRRAASVASADKADDALLRMAQIYDQRLKDSDAAMATWLEIVKQYSGTTVAEDASWKIAQYYETHEKYADAIAAYNSFLRNYRRSPKASDAQAAIAENHEQLGNWVEAMDAYTNYINNYPEGSMASKAKEQIAWIKTYRL